MNISCAICNELLTPSAEIVVTPCGHIFHNICLTQWLPRSSTCPECRQRTTISTIHKLYLNISLNQSILEDPHELQRKLEEAQSLVSSCEKELQTFKLRYERLLRRNSSLEDVLTKKEASNEVLKEQLDHFRKQCNKQKDLEEKVKSLEEKCSKMERVDNLMRATANEVDSMMKGQQSVADLAVYVSILKRELRCSEAKRRDLKSNMQESRLELVRLQTKYNTQQQLLDKNEDLKGQLVELEMERNALFGKIKELERRKCPSSPQNSSPKVKEIVNNIQSTGSPYFQVESSSVGMMPLRSLQINEVEKRKKAEPSQFSIFKKPRLGASQSMASLYAPSTARLNSIQTENMEKDSGSSVSLENAQPTMFGPSLKLSRKLLNRVSRLPQE